MIVAVTGGSGFVGAGIVRELLARGHQVRVLARGTASAEGLADEGVAFIRGNIVDGKGLAELASGADALIHLVGIIKERGSNTFDRVHRLGTARVVQAARDQGVTRFLHMSALGTRPDAVSGYHRSKWGGELSVGQSGTKWTIFRPSIIFGPDDAFVNMLADVMRKTPVMPVIGGGGNLMQPVYVGDVARAFAYALEDDSCAGKIYELGGPDVLSFINILKIISEVLGIKRKFVKIPAWAVRPGLAVSERLHLPVPITGDQLQMLSEDNIRTGGDSLEDFPFPFTPFREGIAGYLKR